MKTLSMMLYLRLKKREREFSSFEWCMCEEEWYTTGKGVSTTRLVWEWYLSELESAYRQIAGKTICRILGHDAVVEDIGGPENGPRISWYCKRCGSGSGGFKWC